MDSRFTMGHLLDDVSHLGHEAFDLGDRPGGKCEELFAQRHDASAHAFSKATFKLRSLTRATDRFSCRIVLPRRCRTVSKAW